MLVTCNYEAAQSGLLFTVDGLNLLIYSLATTQLRIPVTATVQVPKNTNVAIDNTNVAIDTNSFNVPPTQIISGTTFDTLVWHTVLTAVSPSQTFTWLSRVSFLQPGEARAVELGGKVDFTSQGAPGEVPLSTQLVTGQQIIGISPTMQTIAPGAVANYTVTLQNPRGFHSLFKTTVVGLPPGWAHIPFGTVLQPATTVTVQLTITSNSFAPLTDYTFSVLAITNAGAQSFVEADLALQGAPVLPDPASHGVVVSLAPISATAGQGTSANMWSASRMRGAQRIRST